MPCRSTAIGELVDLALVQQQAPGPAGVVLEEGAGGVVLGDVGVDQEDAAPLGRGIALGDVGLAGAQRFDLGAGQLDAGLPGVLDGVLVARLAVLGDALVAVVLAGGHWPSTSRAAAIRRPSPAPGRRF